MEHKNLFNNMEEKTEDSATKLCPSEEKFLKKKDASLSCSSDSGHYSPNDDKAQNGSENSDEGLMNNDAIRDVPDKMLTQILSETNDDKSDRCVNEEEQKDAEMKNDNVAIETDMPCSSPSLLNIKRSRKHLRNYRTAGRSNSTSSTSSTTSGSLSETESASKTAKLSGDLTDSPVDDEVDIVLDSTIVNITNGPTSPQEPPTQSETNVVEEVYAVNNYVVISSDSDDDEPDTDTDYTSPDSLDSIHQNYNDEDVDKILEKPKPAYTWNTAFEVMRRELGLRGDRNMPLRNGLNSSFHNRFYASRHIVERMCLSHALKKHKGFVNCLNFNKTGDLLVTGSDDSFLIVWDWAANKSKYTWKIDHGVNIFQSTFVPMSACIDVIFAGCDGRVRRSIVTRSGGLQIYCIYNHSGPVNKLVMSPDNPWEIISVGEDGFICSKDLREANNKVSMFPVKTRDVKKRPLRLYSVSHHPFAPEICVSGGDSFVRVYDKRSMNEPVNAMSPQHVLEGKTPNVTCCVYNNLGTEILASYSNENIYLFDNKSYVPGLYLHCYKGHNNSKTIKGVNFFGPNSEYVISGSDCGNIFYWDKNTEAILNFMHGDIAGVVNYLEPHPTTPILATSGLDHTIKIWTPSGTKNPPDVSKLRNSLRHNLQVSEVDREMEYDRFLIRQMFRRRRRTGIFASVNDDSADLEFLTDDGDDSDEDLSQ